MSNFRKEYPEFAAIESHIRRAHAERAVAIGTWIAEAIVAAIRGARGLFTPATPQRRGGRLVVKASVSR